MWLYLVTARDKELPHIVYALLVSSNSRYTAISKLKRYCATHGWQPETPHTHEICLLPGNSRDIMVRIDHLVR